MKISGAIFDMDGTLLDTMHIWGTMAIREYAIECGLKLKDDFDSKIGDILASDIAEYLEKEYGFTCTTEQLVEGLYSVAERLYKTEAAPKPGVIEILEDFQSRGIKMCVATATEYHVVKPALERLDLIKYFDDVFTCTMVGDSKRRPTIYETALKKLGTTKSETLVFEDAPYAIRTAKAAGFPVVGIYDRFYESGQEEIRGLADFYITDFRNGLKL